MIYLIALTVLTLLYISYCIAMNDEVTWANFGLIFIFVIVFLGYGLVGIFFPMKYKKEIVQPIEVIKSKEEGICVAIFSNGDSKVYRDYKEFITVTDSSYFEKRVSYNSYGYIVPDNPRHYKLLKK